MISDDEETSCTTCDPIENSMNESSAADGSCSCCSGDISQPTDPSLLQKTEKVYGSGSCIKKHRFLAKWFEASSLTQALRCPCSLAVFYLQIHNP